MMNNYSKNDGLDQKKCLRDVVCEMRLKLESEIIDLKSAAAEFGVIKSMDDIEKLEVTDTEDFIATSRLLELKETAKELIERKRSLENVICLEQSKLHEVINDVEALLVKNSEGESLYQRSGSLVRITKIAFSPQAKPMAIGRPNNAVVIKEIDQAYLTVLLTKLGTFMRVDGRSGASLKIDCPERISRYLLAKQEWALPVLMGIINTPTLRVDGTIFDTPGYDNVSGMLFVSGDFEFKKIPDQPIENDVKWAKEQLLYVIKDFPFEDGVSKSVALAAILTVLIRKSLTTAPLFGFTAPKMGSGKSLLADVVALIGTGKSNSVIAQAENETEEKKRLMAVLIEGDPIVCYDNIEKPFGNAALCAILTQREYKDRLLGGNTTRTVLTNTTFLATGNNLTFMGDISTRALLCKLDSGVEHPEERAFDINLHQYIPENRSQLVRAGLIILRAYHVAGRPKQNIKQFGRFEEWSDWVRSAIVWLDMDDPCESRKDIENADPTRILLGALFPAWYETFGDTGQRANDVIRFAPDSGELHEIFKELAGDNKGDISSRKLAKKLALFKGRIENGFRLEQLPPHQGTSLWRVKKV